MAGRARPGSAHAPQGEVLVQLDDVGKGYGRGPLVLRGAHVHVRRGDLIWVEGGNGVGKSTLLRIVAGIGTPTSGRRMARKGGVRVGYLPEHFEPVAGLSPRGYLQHVARVAGLRRGQADERIAALAARLDMDGQDEQMRRLSKGNCQKVGIAQALLHRPELLVFDEPWGGLDTAAQQFVARMLVDAAASGAAVVVSDHQQVASTLPLTRRWTLHEGAVHVQDVTGRQAAPRPTVRIALSGDPRALAAATGLPVVLATGQDAGRTWLVIPDEESGGLLRWLLDAGCRVHELREQPAHEWSGTDG